MEGGNSLGTGVLASRDSRSAGETSTADTQSTHALNGGKPAPLYERLPRGPHQMDPDAVIEHQRRRMHGAMIEAVATSGYGRTSVRQVVALAGVSRRAFYEQFANKQQCFMATLDLIAAQAMYRITASYRSSEGMLEQRMEAALTTFAEIVMRDPKSSRLMLVEAPSVGPAGWERLTEMLSAFEERLATSFARMPPGKPLPTPVVRAIVGGLRRATFVRLREERTEEMPDLVADMLSWTLVFTTSGPNPLVVRRRPVTGAYPLSSGEDDRARVLRSALELAALEGYANLTPMRIVDEAGVSIDTFFDQFEDMEACFLAAVERLGAEVSQLLSDPGLTSPQWPAAVCRTLDRLMHYFAARPAYAQTIATGVFAIGQRAVDLGAELACEVAAMLTAGAPGAPLTGLAQEGIEGAIWHTIYCQATGGRTGALPELSDYLAYVVLAPFLGADEAAQIVTAKTQPGALAGRGMASG